jgi:hypothetical protein
MPMSDWEYSVLQQAITHTALWIERDVHGDARALLQQLAEENMVTNPHWEFDMLLGLQQLTTILLVKLEAATGSAPEITLQDIATRYRPPG